MARLSYRKSFKVAPGVRLNVTHKGISSISAGAGGVRVTQSLRGKSTGSKRTAAPAGPSFAERLEADTARRNARVAARIGEDGLARRRALNMAILKWTGLALLWIVSLAILPLLVVTVPLTAWVIVRAVRARRVRASVSEPGEV